MEEVINGAMRERREINGRDLWAYAVDTFQRSVLFIDVLRMRGNIYHQHLDANQPPVLHFPYEKIADGHDLDTPVNYSLFRILDRRKKERNPPRQDQRKKSSGNGKEKAPVVIIDPRAGHGPGIGGIKEDSEIGVAISAGHPVYGIFFSSDPVEGQTITHVEEAEIHFLEMIMNFHPQGGRPIIVGNCQGGWAAAILAADRPDLAGVLLINGTPLSYWAGPAGKSPMRYRGGMAGGLWLASFLTDLGDGLMDGAILVANMEDLNPAHTIWKKQYNLYDRIDTEISRYLTFERWWGGFFPLTQQESRFIVRDLFVGNKLERGELSLDNGRGIDLKNISAPVILFASMGDNITPPQQALNWITKVYQSEKEIIRRKQRIVYILHDSIGHLGIFVSSDVARNEHRAIIENIEAFQELNPGLYELIVDKEAMAAKTKSNAIRFEKRTLDDIRNIDGGSHYESFFPEVARLSDYYDRQYRMFFRPWVRLSVAPWMAEVNRQAHPLRWSRYLFSDLNPFLLSVGPSAEWVRGHRQEESQENPYRAAENHFADHVAASLDLFRDVRDATQEYAFKAIFGNPWLKWGAQLCNSISEPDADEA